MKPLMLGFASNFLQAKNKGKYFFRHLKSIKKSQQPLNELFLSPLPYWVFFWRFSLNFVKCNWAHAATSFQIFLCELTTTKGLLFSYPHQQNSTGPNKFDGMEGVKLVDPPDSYMWISKVQRFMNCGLYHSIKISLICLYFNSKKAH